MRHGNPSATGEPPPRLRVPMSIVWPPLTNTFGRSAIALAAFATGPAAIVRYWPAGTPERVKVPPSSVRALTPVLWTATNTAPAGSPEVVGCGCGAGCACASGEVGAAGNGIARMHGPHSTRPVTVPVADCAAAPCANRIPIATSPTIGHINIRQAPPRMPKTSWEKNVTPPRVVPRSVAAEVRGNLLRDRGAAEV